MPRKPKAAKPQPPPPPPPPGPPHKMGYARVSTSDQDMRMQRDALLAAGVDPRDIFEETASGAKLENRREFQAMLKDVRAGDIVYAWKLDRLARSAADLYETARTIEDRGASLVILAMPGMDTATPVGKAIFGMLAVFAEFERAIANERTRAGLAAARARGRVGGRVAKYTLAELEGAYEAAGSHRAAANRLGMTISGFTKALERERGRAMEDQNVEA